MFGSMRKSDESLATSGTIAPSAEPITKTQAKAVPEGSVTHASNPCPRSLPRCHAARVPLNQRKRTAPRVRSA